MKQIVLTLDSSDASELNAPKVTMGIFHLLVRNKAGDLVKTANEELNQLARTHRNLILERLNSSPTLTQDIALCTNEVASAEMKKNQAKFRVESQRQQAESSRSRTTSLQSTAINIDVPTWVTTTESVFDEDDMSYAPPPSQRRSVLNLPNTSIKPKLKSLVANLRAKLFDKYKTFCERVIDVMDFDTQEVELLKSIPPVNLNEEIEYVIYRIERFRF